MKRLQALDFGARPEPPREVVQGFMRERTVIVLAGREGSGKSQLASSLAAALSRGDPWLGLETQRGRVLVVDEENAPADALERLYGYGLRPEDREHVRYFCRQGVQLVARDWARAVSEEIAAFRPSVVIVDGGTSATGVDSLSNQDVTRIMGTFRRWTNEHGCAVLVLHHRPKAARDDDPDAILGAVAWRTQADACFTARAIKPHYEADPTDDGLRESYRYELSATSKVRWGPGTGWVQRFTVSSLRDAEGRMVWLRVESEGGAAVGEKRGPSKEEALALRARDVLAEGPMRRRELATALEVDPGAGTFKRALKWGLDHGVLTSPERGTYGPAEGASF